MDLLQDDLNKQENKSKKMKTNLIIVSVFIFALIIIAIVLYFYMNKAKSNLFKVLIDGTKNSTLSANADNEFIIENGKVYTSVKDICSALGYTYYNGEYNQYSEDTTQCYITNTKELVTFASGHNSIRKYPQLEDAESQNFDISEQVMMRGSKLYVCEDGLEKAFNVQLEYNSSTNQIDIYTLPYLANAYQQNISNCGLDDIQDQAVLFNDQKALLYGYVIIEDENSKLFGMSIYNKGNLTEAITPRYKKIEFIEGINDFIVQTEDNKYGIIGNNGITKVKPEYSQIAEIDKDEGLYLVTSNNKQGVINQNGKFIVYQDYDQIGLKDNEDTNITNKYLLYGNCIPVMRDSKWGLVDINGNTILPLEYDGIGCKLGTKINNSVGVTLIPDINGIVVEKDTNENNTKIKKYGIVSSTGAKMVNYVADSVYSTTLEGKTTYYISVQNQEIDIVSFWYEQKNAGTNSSNNNENEIENSASENVMNGV